MNTLKKLFGLSNVPEITEVDIGNASPLRDNVKNDLLNHCKQCNDNIKAYFKVIKKDDGAYVFEGALAYYEKGKNKILYLNQDLHESHIHGTVISQMIPKEELSWEEEAKTYQELASKLEKYILSDNPNHNENGYDHAIVEITNNLGMHARAAAKFVSEAIKYKSEIYVRNGKDVPLADVEIAGKKYVDGKSIMSLLTLAAGQGSLLEIIVQGNDSDRALNNLAALVKNKFYED